MHHFSIRIVGSGQLVSHRLSHVSDYGFAQYSTFWWCTGQCIISTEIYLCADQTSPITRLAGSLAIRKVVRGRDNLAQGGPMFRARGDLQYIHRIWTIRRQSRDLLTPIVYYSDIISLEIYSNLPIQLNVFCCIRCMQEKQ